MRSNDGVSNDAILASDAERHQAVALLSDACGEGRLTLEEISDRTRAVFAARTRGDLASITADLPKTALAIPGNRNAKRTTVAILSDIKRKGRWRIDGETKAISVLGSCTLDLRNALIQGNEVVINAYVVLGALKIIVPFGTPVELEGFTVLGNRDSKVDDADDLPNVPTVRVRGMTVLGSVDVVNDDRHGIDRLVDRFSERLEERHQIRERRRDTRHRLR